MASNSTINPVPASNMTSATAPGTECALDLSLLSILDDDAFLSLYYSSALAFGDPWSLAALPAPSTGFDFQNYASGAFNPEIPSTQTGVSGHVYPLFSPLPVTSPATSTESFSPFGLEHSFDDIIPSLSSAGYSGFAFPSPATMGQGITLPFLVGPSPPVAHAARITPAHTVPGILSPCSAAASLVCQPVVSSASASLVQAPGTPAQGVSSRQESLFTCIPTSAGQPLVSFALSRS
jgi:hypothetical protein